MHRSICCERDVKSLYWSADRMLWVRYSTIVVRRLRSGTKRGGRHQRRCSVGDLPLKDMVALTT
jgi:hypothetical protein